MKIFGSNIPALYLLFFYTTLFICLKGSENNKFLKIKQTLRIVFIKVSLSKPSTPNPFSTLSPQLHPTSSLPIPLFALFLLFRLQIKSHLTGLPLTQSRPSISWLSPLPLSLLSHYNHCRSITCYHHSQPLTVATLFSNLGQVFFICN